MIKIDNMAVVRILSTWALLFLWGCVQETSLSEREAMYHRYLDFPSYVTGGSIEAQWIGDGNSFWYAEGDSEETIIWIIEPEGDRKTPLIDTARLRQALAGAFGLEPAGRGVPFRDFHFRDETEVEFELGGQTFVLSLVDYDLSLSPSIPNPHAVPQVFWTRPGWGEMPEELSPDGQWLAGVRDHNLYLRSTLDGRTLALTADGEPWYEWNLAGAVPQSRWSPDGSKLAVRRIDSRQVPEMHRTDATPWQIEYETRTEVFVIDIRSGRQVLIEDGGSSGERIQIVGWRPDGSELLYLVMDRAFKRLDLRAANAASGATRVIITERQETFVMGAGWERRQVFTPLEDGERFIWSSERDGWNHLYLYGLDGTLIRRLTSGSYPIVQVEAVDEREGWLYFTASDDQMRPYDIHLYRVTLEGRSLERLTEQPGQHTIAFSPSKMYYMDTHSAPDRPPVVELRRADGRLIQVVSRANVDALRDLQWQPPEQFVVSAGDGRTDLHGLLYKPYDFDPGTTYPVIE